MDDELCEETDDEEEEEMLGSSITSPSLHISLGSFCLAGSSAPIPLHLQPYQPVRLYLPFTAVPARNFEREIFDRDSISHAATGGITLVKLWIHME
ncbi:hypothetical protein PENSOL_c009G09197 [Penicillium solitum]|uniref:Uncharacterized protein n=1 Tax=Penicillium solitum TaxID=60172 RepID=A0A1V6RAU3_9EURO|nr:uncharacterized protein PENSOL_c009G09197 [Penicillium solitum]OQD98393.1 hypothetical protein PENSOL_c009G09197 [Penicillium solitum]